MLRSFALAALLAWVTAAQAEPFTFAALGDAPYNWNERDAMGRMLDTFGREGLAFAVHVGDLKSGHSDCNDATYTDRLKLLDGTPVPMVLIPGDNDWTDCARVASGGWVPEERLARLRAIFFARPESLGRQRMPLERQPTGRDGCCPENVRWWREGILFIGLHVVGSSNNRGSGTEPKPEYVTRTAANSGWLEEGFTLARERKAPAVVLFIHANAGLEQIGRFARPYADVLDTVKRESVAFGRPVLLVHGDTHRFQVDRPWWRTQAREGVRNLQRIEVPGSPTVAWVPVHVDPASVDVFTVAAPRLAPTAIR
jgi:hypothetical protein